MYHIDAVYCCTCCAFHGLCCSHGWTVQKRMNRSWASLVDIFFWAQKTVSLMCTKYYSLYSLYYSNFFIFFYIGATWQNQWTIHERRRCSLMSNYFHHLSLLCLRPLYRCDGGIMFSRCLSDCAYINVCRGGSILWPARRGLIVVCALLTCTLHQSQCTLQLCG